VASFDTCNAGRSQFFCWGDIKRGGAETCGHRPNRSWMLGIVRLVCAETDLLAALVEIKLAPGSVEMNMTPRCHAGHPDRRNPRR
jgi:hypothetical protein